MRKSVAFTRQVGKGDRHKIQAIARSPTFLRPREFEISLFGRGRLHSLSHCALVVLVSCCNSKPPKPSMHWRGIGYQSLLSSGVEGLSMFEMDIRELVTQVGLLSVPLVLLVGNALIFQSKFSFPLPAYTG